MQEIEKMVDRQREAHLPKYLLSDPERLSQLKPEVNELLFRWMPEQMSLRDFEHCAAGLHEWIVALNQEYEIPPRGKKNE